MKHLFFLLLIGFFFFSSCREEKKGNQSTVPKRVESEVKSPKKQLPSTRFKPEPEPKIIPRVLPPIDPEPYPIVPGPYPDPPGYISDPVITCVGTPDPLPKTIRDSIVNFPTIQASFGVSIDDLMKYIDYKIANSMEWSYLKELGSEGKIYIRLLIDVKGKVREVTFLKFTDKQLEILKNRLNVAFLGMPNWTPAKNENGQNVVSEYTFPFRIQFD